MIVLTVILTFNVIIICQCPITPLNIVCRRKKNTHWLLMIIVRTFTYCCENDNNKMTEKK